MLRSTLYALLLRLCSNIGNFMFIFEPLFYLDFSSLRFVIYGVLIGGILLYLFCGFGGNSLLGLLEL